MNNNIYVSNVEVTNNEVVLIPNREIKNLTNCGNYGLVLCCGSSASQNLPVYIQTSIGNVPLLCKYGNEIYSSQLNRRYRYPLGYGNQNSNYERGQFIITSCNCINQRSTIEPSTSL